MELSFPNYMTIILYGLNPKRIGLQGSAGAEIRNISETKPGSILKVAVLITKAGFPSNAMHATYGT